MTRDELKAIIAGTAETLKLVSRQPEFQKVSQILITQTLRDIVEGAADEILLVDALDKVVGLLDLIYERLDQEVPQREPINLLDVD